MELGPSSTAPATLLLPEHPLPAPRAGFARHRPHSAGTGPAAAHGHPSGKSLRSSQSGKLEEKGICLLGKEWARLTPKPRLLSPRPAFLTAQPRGSRGQLAAPSCLPSPSLPVPSSSLTPRQAFPISEHTRLGALCQK